MTQVQNNGKTNKIVREKAHYGQTNKIANVARKINLACVLPECRLLTTYIDLSVPYSPFDVARTGLVGNLCHHHSHRCCCSRAHVGCAAWALTSRCLDAAVEEDGCLSPDLCFRWRRRFRFFFGQKGGCTFQPPLRPQLLAASCTHASG